jgi:hypothetical protein
LSRPRSGGPAVPRGERFVLAKLASRSSFRRPTGFVAVAGRPAAGCLSRFITFAGQPLTGGSATTSTTAAAAAATGPAFLVAWFTGRITAVCGRFRSGVIGRSNRFVRGPVGVALEIAVTIGGATLAGFLAIDVAAGITAGITISGSAATAD